MSSSNKGLFINNLIRGLFINFLIKGGGEVYKSGLKSPVSKDYATVF